MSPVVFVVAGAACLPPGTLVGPGGTVELRTAIYAVGVTDGAPELKMLLSNGLFECGIPKLSDETEQDLALQGIFAAACREGAQHTSLHLYQGESTAWAGTFQGKTYASADDLTPERARLARGAYHSIEEAFLVELDGLVRGYAVAEEEVLPDLGDGGEVTLDLDEGDRLLGRFSFPDEGVSGEFRATRCGGDTSLLEALTTLPSPLCP